MGGNFHVPAINIVLSAYSLRIIGMAGVCPVRPLVRPQWFFLFDDFLIGIRNQFSLGVYLFLCNQCRISVKFRIGKEPGGAPV